MENDEAVAYLLDVTLGSGERLLGGARVQL